ncbi:MAG TPA: hypothetical protein VKV26_14850 [Dehalococcoidia bacterium]|nr:hypothetical protein [Dehalococcoidia bacterium]
MAEGILGRWERMWQQRKEHGQPAPVESTPQTLKPGDAIMLWNGDDRLVQSALECAEHLNSRETDWRWLLLDGGAVLEVTPGHTTYYDQNEVIYQGSVEFQRLVGDQDGLLRVFEARVRDGTVALNPVTFEKGGAAFQVASTGTFFVQQAAGAALDLDVWRDITPNEVDNVYVKLNGPLGGKALGVWTTHIAFLRGQEVGPSDLRCYGQ